LSYAAGGSEQGTLYFETANAGTLSEKMRIDYLGNVGIGTTAPGELLHVAGSANTTVRAETTSASGYVYLTVVGTGGYGGVAYYGPSFATTQFADRVSVISQTNTGTGGLDLRADDASGDIRLYTGGVATTNERMRITSGGNVGIGTSAPVFKLVVGDGLAATEATSSIQVPRGGICVDNDGWCNASTTGRVSARSFNTGGSDIAENYASDELLEAGDVVITKGNETIGKADASTVSSIIGVVSSSPGFILGLDEDLTPALTQYPVALVGRVPVKVSLENGLIKVGDKLTISSTMPGVAMKATEDGLVIGTALEDFDGWTKDASAHSLNYSQTGKLLVFINLGYSKLTMDSESDLSEITQDMNLNNNNIINVKSIAGLLGPDGLPVWSIDETGKLVAREIETDKLKVKEEVKIGSPEKRIGITIYDEQTGEPYCLKMRGGQMISEAGECISAEQAQTLNTAAEQAAEQGESAVAGTSTPETISLINSQPTPTATPEPADSSLQPTSPHYGPRQ
jgi:hypothetical protein